MVHTFYGRRTQDEEKPTHYDVYGKFDPTNHLNDCQKPWQPRELYRTPQIVIIDVIPSDVNADETYMGLSYGIGGFYIRLLDPVDRDSLSNEDLEYYCTLHFMYKALVQRSNHTTFTEVNITNPRLWEMLQKKCLIENNPTDPVVLLEWLIRKFCCRNWREKIDYKFNDEVIRFAPWDLHSNCVMD